MDANVAHVNVKDWMDVSCRDGHAFIRKYAHVNVPESTRSLLGICCFFCKVVLAGEILKVSH